MQNIITWWVSTVETHIWQGQWQQIVGVMEVNPHMAYRMVLVGGFHSWLETNILLYCIRLWASLSETRI